MKALPVSILISGLNCWNSSASGHACLLWLMVTYTYICIGVIAALVMRVWAYSSLTFGLYSSHAAWTTVMEGGSGSCFWAHTHMLMFCCCGWREYLFSEEVKRSRCADLHSPYVYDVVLIQCQ